jgi:hypothetical protein
MGISQADCSRSPTRGSIGKQVNVRRNIDTVNAERPGRRGSHRGNLNK